MDNASYLTIFGNVAGMLRFSEYLPEDKVSEHIMRLRHFYNVGYYETEYHTKTCKYYFDFTDNKAEDIVIVRGTTSLVDDVKNLYKQEF